jgi:hypothetical protein
MSEAMGADAKKPEREPATDRPVTADDLKGVAAVPQDGEGKDNRSGANAAERQGDEVDPGAG